ncbi:hypothetical protein BGX38DRAFT_179574 [Terfezia claveryi]|nr:hypothetical protein BGX38DRAFT_179574 [Terfezia claveryi]
MPTNTADNWDPIPITAEEAVWEPRVFLICELLRSSNMDVSLFFTRLMSSKSKRLKEKQRSFIENKGFEKVFEAMLSVMSYNTKKKQNSTASILELKQKLGVGLWRVIQQILESEMKAYSKQPEAESRRPVQSITPELATAKTLWEKANDTGKGTIHAFPAIQPGLPVQGGGLDRLRARSAHLGFLSFRALERGL